MSMVTKQIYSYKYERNPIYLSNQVNKLPQRNQLRNSSLMEYGL